MKCKIGTLVLTVASFLLNSCVPWTIRPIDAEKEQSSGSAASSPAAYVDAIWRSKLIPMVTGNEATDARLLLDALAASPENAKARYGHQQANGPVYFIVKGEGVITAVDLHSHSGVALVDIPPFDQRPDVSIQLGPILRGTSLRDATGLVQFSDFVNQLQFADVGNELNDRVLKTVLAPLDKMKLKGSTVSFAGTVAMGTNPDVPLSELVPVKLVVEGSH